ncbi:MAG: ABC transporter permease [Ignavibacteriaceae bacterium]|nr:ABC transporter permease [Ignavibacteriaceae bacterium]
MTGLFVILKREAGIIIKDVDLKSIVILAPLFYSFFYAAIYFNKAERDVPVVVIDMDRSTLSKKLTKNIDANEFLKVTGDVLDYNGAKDLIYNETVQAAIIIPKGFESSVKSYKGSSVKLLINSTRFLVSNDINKAMNEVLLNFNNDIKIVALQQNVSNYHQAVIVSEPLKEEVKFLGNPFETYGDFLIPALLVLIIQQTLLMGISESVSRERELGTLGDLFSKSNYSVSASVIGKGMFYFLLFGSYSLLFYTLHFRLFSINQKGSWLLVFFMTFLFLFSVICFGIIIASFIKRKLLALQIMAITSYPIFFLSGYSWPVKNMPVVLQAISQFIPFTPFINAFIRITQLGAGLYDVIPQILQLILLSLIGCIIAYFRMKYILTKDHNVQKLDHIIS